MCVSLYVGVETIQPTLDISWNICIQNICYTTSFLILGIVNTSYLKYRVTLISLIYSFVYRFGIFSSGTFNLSFPVLSNLVLWILNGIFAFKIYAIRQDF